MGEPLLAEPYHSAAAASTSSPSHSSYWRSTAASASIPSARNSTSFSFQSGAGASTSSSGNPNASTCSFAQPASHSGQAKQRPPSANGLSSSSSYRRPRSRPGSSHSTSNDAPPRDSPSLSSYSQSPSSSNGSMLSPPRRPTLSSHLSQSAHVSAPKLGSSSGNVALNGALGIGSLSGYASRRGPSEVDDVRIPVSPPRSQFGMGRRSESNGSMHGALASEDVAAKRMEALTIDGQGAGRGEPHPGPESAAFAAAADDQEEHADEPIEQIVYTSSAYTRDIPASEIEHILASSRRNNERDDITGLLLYRDGSFVQFLEGPQSKVQQCYDRIARDPRHRGLVVIYRKSADTALAIDGALDGSASKGKSNGAEEIQHPYRKRSQQKPQMPRRGSSEGTNGRRQSSPSSPGRPKRDFQQWSMAFRQVGHPAGGENSSLHGYSTEQRSPTSASAPALSRAGLSGSGSESGGSSRSGHSEGQDRPPQPRDGVFRRSSDPDDPTAMTTTVQDESDGGAAFSELLTAGKIELPADMSQRMQTLVKTFVKLLNRPL